MGTTLVTYGIITLLVVGFVALAHLVLFDNSLDESQVRVTPATLLRWRLSRKRTRPCKPRRKS